MISCWKDADGECNGGWDGDNERVVGFLDIGLKSTWIVSVSAIDMFVSADPVRETDRPAVFSCAVSIAGCPM